MSCAVLRPAHPGTLHPALYQNLVGRLYCAASDWHPSGVDFGISHAVLMLSEEVEHAGNGLPAGMLLREVSQRADDLADAVLPFLQGLAERLEPVPRLRRSLPVAVSSASFKCCKACQQSNTWVAPERLPRRSSTSSFSIAMKHGIERQAIVLCRRGHPFDGQTIRIANRRRREGSGRLIVEAEFADGRRQWIPARWTSLEASMTCEVALYGCLSDFVALAELVGALERREADGRGSGIHAVQPAGMAGSTPSMGSDPGGCAQRVCGGAGAINGPCGGSGAGR